MEVVLKKGKGKYRFSKTKLQQRGCRGLLKLIEEHENTNSLLFLTSGDNLEHGFTFTHPCAPIAMTLLSEWVDTGRLQPTTKHTSTYKALWHYFLLYFIATHLASEALCDSVVDEIIAWYEDCKRIPDIANTTYVLEMGTEQLPKPLEDLFVQYFEYQPSLLENVKSKEDWEELGALQQPLFMAMVRGSLGKTSVGVPSRKISCTFHVHKETQPCKQ